MVPSSPYHPLIQLYDSVMFPEIGNGIICLAEGPEFDGL